MGFENRCLSLQDRHYRQDNKRNVLLFFAIKIMIETKSQIFYYQSSMSFVFDILCFLIHSSVKDESKKSQ